VPATQAGHELAPAADEEPGAHGWQADAAMAPVLAEKVPAAHSVHAESAAPPAVAA